MTVLEAWAVFLYSAGTVFAIAGPAIAASRLLGAFRSAKAREAVTWNDFDEEFDARARERRAAKKAVWGLTEFALVALGVVCGSVASILLIVGA